MVQIKDQKQFYFHPFIHKLTCHYETILSYYKIQIQQSNYLYTIV